MRRRNKLVGQRQPNQRSAMSATACDIAVSEIMAWPLEQICGYTLLVVKHLPDGAHELAIVPSDYDDLKFTERWLERALADIRSIR